MPRHAGCFRQAAVPACALLPNAGDRMQLMAIATLKRRSEFLRIRGGRRWSTPAFVIEMRARGGSDEPMRGDQAQDRGTGDRPVDGRAGPPRFGFTATKKLGNAVMRNRIRRRLKEMVRLAAPVHACDGHDYVLVARPTAATRPFAALERDLIAALAALHAPPRDADRASPPRRSAPRTPSTSSRT